MGGLLVFRFRHPCPHPRRQSRRCPLPEGEGLAAHYISWTDGYPGTDFAFITARRMASETISAARAPMAVRFALAVTVPVDMERSVSPSDGVCVGLIARAMPSWAISAILVIWVLSKRALVATTPMVVF